MDLCFASEIGLEVGYSSCDRFKTGITLGFRFVPERRSKLYFAPEIGSELGLFPE